MKIYISGISGTGMGPLALMAKDAGFEVCGSDLNMGAIYDELVKAGIEVEIGSQDGTYLKDIIESGLDWFVYTSALPEDHAELVMARSKGIKCTKRDDLTAYLVEELGLKMIAVAGTHGKTTTTAMIVWAALKLNLPVAYIVGTTLGFASSAAYKTGDKYFVYEADEYDRNFLKYHPWLAVIPAVSYDHPDIYPTREDYEKAFLQFEGQSEKVIFEGVDEKEFELAGEVRRKDAGLAAVAVLEIIKNENKTEDLNDVRKILNSFPGVGRRFERIADGVYTDYAHHPEEIKATIDVVKDEKRLHGYKGVVVVYQPHQNTRQHEVRHEYKDAFVGVDKIFWLPTYLTRENPDLEVLKPEDFIKDLANVEVAESAEIGDELAEKLKEYVKEGYLVILMTAGPADGWLRGIFGA
jgi:UDP-N-acetylmuramate--alanine ligase